MAGIAALLGFAHGATGSHAQLSPHNSVAKYKTNIFQQKLDHFNPLETRTWNHRYLTNDDSWDGRGKLPNGCKGPILLYTGNEGPITAFWDSNGFMIDVLAPKLGAMVVFPEERYYGESLPFGNTTFNGDPENLKFLTTAQVLADYAHLVTVLKSSTRGLEQCPVVAFGGSYGGTLTTFFRLTYPNIVVGGLAASAPIGYYDPMHWSEHGVNTYTWAEIASRDYHAAHPQCMKAIQTARNLIDKMNDTSKLVKLFNVCEPSGLGRELRSDLFSYALESMPQLNYPAPYGLLPAWPVNDTCNVLVDAVKVGDDALIEAAATVTKRAIGNVNLPCMPTLSEGPGDVPGDGPGGINAWSFQSCTETLHEFSSSVAKGHIRDFHFELEKSANVPCRRLFHHTPNTNALTEEFGGFDISANRAGITNIIWSNGGQDPWHGGGFYLDGHLPNASTPLHQTDGLNQGRHYIWINRGAHHGDLKGPTPTDPPELTAARELEMKIIKGWIAGAN